MSETGHTEAMGNLALQAEEVVQGEDLAQVGRNDLIKLIALLAMTIDHIGLFLFPTVTTFRLIGRISFPLFAYQLGVSYRKTSSKPKLALRLLLFGLISQPVYGALVPGHINVFFTLLYCLAIFWCCDHFGIYGKFLGFFLVLLSFKLLFLDNGLYGMICAFGYYALPVDERDDKMLLCFAYQVFLTFLYTSMVSSKLQIFSLLALFPILYPFKKQIQLPKYLFYTYYPLHLCVIWGILKLFSGIVA